MDFSASKYRPLRHLLFWVLWFVYRLTNALSSRSLKADHWWGDEAIMHILLIDLLIMVVFAYGIVYFIVPKLLDTKKYLLFFLALCTWFYFIAALYSATYYYYLENLYTVYIWGNKEAVAGMGKRLTNLPFLLSLFSNFIVPVLVLGVIKFYKNKTLLSKIEEEKNKMELRVLKNQLNPHFLFNTLNNLYSFVVTKSPKAPEMVLQLSGILDYALYKSQQKFVSLSEEILAIENFIALEQIRYGDRLQVVFDQEVKGPLQVSPLLLLSMVENAFKHGASGDIEAPKIKIDLKEKNNKILFNVWNTKSNNQGELNDDYKKGIGLSNIKRQLDLTYPNQHELSITDETATFNLSLTIRLS